MVLEKDIHLFSNQILEKANAKWNEKINLQMRNKLAGHCLKCKFL
jgi:hypothetical protein